MIDTIWGSYTGVKIAAGTIATTIVNSTADADYVLDSPVVQLLRFSLLNYRAALTTRNVTITVNATRK